MFVMPCPSFIQELVGAGILCVGMGSEIGQAGAPVDSCFYFSFKESYNFTSWNIVLPSFSATAVCLLLESIVL